MRAMTIIVGLVLISGIAFGDAEIYFGEDQGVGRFGPRPNSEDARASWLATLETFQVEDFEGFAADATADLHFDLGPIVTVLSGYGYVRYQPSDTYAGTFPTSGDQFWLVDNPNAPFTITFDSPQQAFGFYATDVGDIGVQLVFVSDVGHTITVPNGVSVPSGGALFFGVVDEENPFTTVTLVPMNTVLDGYGIDDLHLGWRPGAVAVEGKTLGAVRALF